MNPEEQHQDDLCLLAVVRLAPLNGRTEADPRMKGYAAYMRLVDAGLGKIEEGAFWSFTDPAQYCAFCFAVMEDWVAQRKNPWCIRCTEKAFLGVQHIPDDLVNRAFWAERNGWKEIRSGIEGELVGTTPDGISGQQIPHEPESLCQK